MRIAHPARWLAWLLSLSLSLLLACSTGFAHPTGDMSHVDVLGFRSGMSAADADAAIGRLTKVANKQEMGGREGRTRRVYINFDDERALYLHFNTPADGGDLAELRLTLQGAGNRTGVGADFEKRYGKPTQKLVRPDPKERVLVWGGVSQGQDAVKPGPGVKTILRIDEQAQSTTIILLRFR